MEKQVIPIDPDGRYVIILRGVNDGSSIYLSKEIEAWWESEEKFFILSSPSGVEVTLERLDE